MGTVQFGCGDRTGTFSRLAQINAPVLLIAGAEDIVTPPQNSVMMAGKIPSSFSAENSLKYLR